MALGTKLLLTAAAAGLAAAGLSGPATSPAKAAEKTINGASCWPMGHPVTKPFQVVLNEINKRGKGVVQVKLVGGAPAIGSPFTLTQKMARGAYDIIGCTEAYFGNVIPEAPVLRFSEHPWQTLRQNGALAYASRLLDAKNIHYVGRYWTFGPFHLWLKNPISKPDLKGLNLRVAPVYTAFFKALGATVQQASTAQVYTLMENGTVQGYGWPAAGWVPPWAKVTGYRVDPGFYDASLHLLLNKKSWNGLSKAQQDLITKVTLEFEAKAGVGTPKLMAIMKAQDAFRAKAGMKIITFTGADRKKYLDTAREAGWKEVLDRSPKHGAALKKLFTK
jgi:TRAP-type C4-dicarboxylate transport system substrate-binding protein